MDHVRRFYRPSLRSPRALLAWEGWNDACEAASGAATYLLADHEGSEPFAALEPEEFYDFQVRRPRVEIDENGARCITWPVTQAYEVPLPEARHDAVVVMGEEPSLRWKTYTRSLARLLAESDVELVVTLGAFIGQVPHSRPVPIIGVASDPDLIDGMGLLSSRYEGPTGIVSVMTEACREVGIPTVSLWAAAPHYLAANPNPKVMLALLEAASSLMEIPVDLSEMTEAAAEFEAKVDEAMADDDDFVDYVRRLEREAVVEPLDPSRSDAMISEIESFLKER